MDTNTKPEIVAQGSDATKTAKPAPAKKAAPKAAPKPVVKKEAAAKPATPITVKINPDLDKEATLGGSGTSVKLNPDLSNREGSEAADEVKAEKAEEARAAAAVIEPPAKVKPVDEHDMLLAAELYAAMIRSNPGYVGMPSPAWGNYVRAHLHALREYAEKNGISRPVLRAATVVYGGMLSTNPGQIPVVTPVWVMSAFRHAEIVASVFNKAL